MGESILDIWTSMTLKVRGSLVLSENGEGQFDLRVESGQV